MSLGLVNAEISYIPSQSYGDISMPAKDFESKSIPQVLEPDEKKTGNGILINGNNELLQENGVCPNSLTNDVIEVSSPVKETVNGVEMKVSKSEKDRSFLLASSNTPSSCTTSFTNSSTVESGHTDDSNNYGSLKAESIPQSSQNGYTNKIIDTKSPDSALSTRNNNNEKEDNMETEADYTTLQITESDVKKNTIEFVDNSPTKGIVKLNTNIFRFFL